MIKASFGVVRKDPELMVYPVISTLILILFTILIVFGLLFTGWIFDQISLVITFVFLYFISHFLMIYSNVALIGAATVRLEGGDPTLRTGIVIANQNLGSILKWALMSAFVGLILRAIKKKFGIAGAITSGIMGFAWAMMTFFIIPVLIYEKKGIFRSMQRSGSLFRGTWGETFLGQFGLGVIFLLLAIPGMAIIILPLLLGMYDIYILLMLFFVAVIYWAILAVLYTAVNGVLIAALYRYALTGKLQADFRSYRQYIPNRISPNVR